jgi:hyperosmotically inducible protein
MRTTRTIMTKVALGVALLGSAVMAKPTHPKTLEQQVMHEILTVPYLGVFDNPAFAIENGVVTLSGQVTQPVEKYNIEQAVKTVKGVTRVNNQIEVLPLSPFDDQIRYRTLNALLRSGPLNKYFLGVQPAIRIIVKNGNVTLDGVVLNNFDRQVAYMAANGISGVFSVTNNLHTEGEMNRGR